MSTPLHQTIEANNNSTVEQGDDGDDADPLSYTGAIVTTVGGSKRKKCMQDPTGLAVASNGHLIVADTLNHRLVKLDPNTTKCATFVGMRENRGYRDGETARFFAPYDVCFGPDDNIYVADSGNNKIRCVTPDGRTTTFVGYRQGGYKDEHGQKAKFDGPYSIAFDMSTETFYVADCNNHAIRKITTDGTVTTLAGGGEPGLKDGKCSVAKFNCPTSLCVDKGGTIYVADWGNHVVRRINRDGAVTTITNTTFEEPSGVAVDDDGTLFVTDAGLHQLFRITNTTTNNNNNNNTTTNINNNSNVGDGDGVDVVTLIAGGGGVGYVDGVVANAKFNYPTGLTIDKWGNLYVTDTQNKRVRMISGLAAKNTQYPTAVTSTVKAESFNDNHASSSVATSSTGKSPAKTISKGSLAKRQALCAKMVLSAEAVFVAAEKKLAKAKTDLKHADDDLSSFHAKIAAGELDKLDVAESHELLLMLGVTVSISKLQDERVAGAVFAELTDADMERVLGMTKLGDRLVMKRLIRRLIKGDGLPKETEDTPGVFGWDVARVGVWLKSQGFGKFVKSFIKHAINGIALTELHPDDLWSLGVTNLGEKTELKRAIANNLPLYHECVSDVAPTLVPEQIEAGSHANSDNYSHAHSTNSSTTTNNNNTNANSNNSNATTTSKNINNSATTSITTLNNNNNNNNHNSNSNNHNNNNNNTTNTTNTTNDRTHHTHHTTAQTSAALLPPLLSIAEYVQPPDIATPHTVTPTHILTTTHTAIPTHDQPLLSSPSPVIESSTATTSDTAMMDMATVNTQTSVLASTTTTSPTTSITLPPTTVAATTTQPPPTTTTTTTSTSPSLSTASTPPYIPLTSTGSTMSASTTTIPTTTVMKKQKTVHNNATTTPLTPTTTPNTATTTATATATIAASNTVPTKRKRQPTTTTTPTKPKPKAKPNAKPKQKLTATRNNKRKASINDDDVDDNDSNNNADDADHGDDNIDDEEGVKRKSDKKARQTTKKDEEGPGKKSAKITKRGAKKEEKVTKGRAKKATKQIEAPISLVVYEETNEKLDTTFKTNSNTSNNNNNINTTTATNINNNNKKTTNNAVDDVSNNNNNNDNDKHGTDRLPVNTHVTLRHTNTTTTFDNNAPSMLEIITNNDIANDVDMDVNTDVNTDVNNVGGC